MYIYSDYHIPSHPSDGKSYVGCTINLKERMRQHGVSMKEVDILFQSEDIIEASYAEQQYQKIILGEADGLFYHLTASEERNKSISYAIKGISKPKVGDALRGVTRGPYSFERCQAISAGRRGQSAWNKGIHNSPEHCKAIGASQKDLVWVCNPTESRRIKKDQLDDFLATGYQRGRTYKVDKKE